MAYKDLSLKERHAIIRESVSRGIHRLSEIEAMYDASHAIPEQQIAVAPIETAPQEAEINTQPNLLAEGGGIHIKPSKRGTFTAEATKHGKSVQAFASQVLAHKENYSPAMVKKANFARNFGGHRHDDGGYNWLPDFTYNPSIQSHSGRQLVQSVLQDENIQRAVQQKALQRQAEIEARRKAVSEIYNGMPNPGAGYVSGTDPLLQAIVDITPAGDAEMATEAASELRNGNLKEAGLLGAALLLPNIFNKGIKNWRASKFISKALNNGVKNSDLQISAFDKGVLSGKIGWAPSQDISWRHGSTNPNLTKFVPYDRWDVVNRGASPYEYFVTEKSSPLNMMDERPFQYYGSYAARKPLIQVGEFNLNGQKNSTRNSLLQEGWKRGADSYILQGISDNKAIGQNVVVIPIGAEGELIHSTGGPLYPFSFSKQPLPPVRH